MSKEERTLYEPTLITVDRSWEQFTRDAEYLLGSAVLKAPSDNVARLNRAISAVRFAIPHEFVEGMTPSGDTCKWCWNEREDH